MIDKKNITPGGLNLLMKVMQTCPPTPFNGGESAKKHLQCLCQDGKSVSSYQLLKGLDVSVVCDCEETIDVYTHLFKSTHLNQLDELEIMRYFGGDIHAQKIFASAKSDGFPSQYCLKIVWGHLLTAVVLTDAAVGSAVGFDGIMVKNLLKLAENKRVYNDGDIVLIHYGFILRIASAKEKNFLDDVNMRSELFLEAQNILQGKIDFATMHYFPRSKKMAQ